MDCIYRLGTFDDVESLQKLALNAYEGFKETLTPDNWAEMNGFLSSEQTYLDLMSKSTCFVCENNQRIIGMAFIIPHGHPTNLFQADWSYIRMVGVHSAFGGRGIGKKLIQLCIDFAKSTDEKIIALHTTEFMETAIHIYEKLGFKKVEELALTLGKRNWIYIFEIPEE
jgi:ribosomal protein S18 acetylase RimI-like enzyme